MPVNPPPTGLADGVAGTASAGAVWIASGNVDEAFLNAYSTVNAKPVQTVRLTGADPGAVAADSQGDLWLTLGSSLVGGAVEEVTLGPSGWTAQPPVALGDQVAAVSIATGPDGKTMWVSEPALNAGNAATNELASITAGATVPVRQFSLPTGVSGTLGQIVLGPDGNMYAGLTGSAGSPSYVLQIAPPAAGATAPTITPFELPSDSTADPGVLAVGPDKLLWMAGDGMAGGGMLTSMTTAGVFSDYAGILPTTPTPLTVRGIASDPSADALWLTTAPSASAAAGPPSAIYRVALAPPTGPTGPTSSTGPSGPTRSTGPTGSTQPSSPPALTTTVSEPSGVTKTAATLSGTISEQAGAAATPVTYHFDYGTTTNYGQSTPSATTTAMPAGVTVSAQASGLQPYTTYHYQLVANDCTPSTSCPATVSSDRTFTTGTSVTPVQNVNVGAQPIAGTVRVELPGKHRFKTLSAGATIPVGSMVGTRNGTVLLVSKTGPGEQASGQFSKGIFKVTQPKGGAETVLTLVSNYSVCPHTASTVKARIINATVAAAKPNKPKKPKKAAKPKKKSTKVVNEVFGDAHGQFKTRGHYATAADEGTKWQTIDRCDGTQIAVTVGKVTVTDFTHHRRLTLTAGHRYLSPAP